MTPGETQYLARIAGALERIAEMLILSITEPAEQTCAHPDAEREVAPGSVMGNISYLCKACGEPCPEPGT